MCRLHIVACIVKSQCCNLTDVGVLQIYASLRSYVKVVTPKCLGGPPVDRDRLNAYPGHKGSETEAGEVGNYLKYESAESSARERREKSAFAADCRKRRLSAEIASEVKEL
ncbi:hypothetical protein TNCV_4197931 [Trichonephila clavipes]|nr:hypothetical protein TNCV_4197931 [Trichonephila clavipes]